MRRPASPDDWQSSSQVQRSADRVEESAVPLHGWLKIHLWAGFAIFHWSCFAEFFKHGDETKVEDAIWRAEHNR